MREHTGLYRVQQSSIDEAFQRFSDAANRAAQDISDMILAFADTVAGCFKSVMPTLSFLNDERILSHIWACGNKPEWVHIMNRTKRKRIKKKYADRILREYRMITKDGDADD